MNFARKFDQTFVIGIRLASLLVIALVLVIFVALIVGSQQAFDKFGFSFFVGREWNPVRESYGALPFIAGTIITAFFALLLSIPFSLSISLYLGEFFHKGRLSTLFSSLVELLAGIPSVIYGFWALFYLVPLVRKLETALDRPPVGVGIISASLILAIMIIPFSASIGREVIRMVPTGLKEAAYSLGATRFEVIRDVIFPVSRSGIVAGLFLALGRALGETMAVTMVIGNMNILPDSIFDPANTIASVIANEFAEASDQLFLSALTQLALVLFLITGVINLTGKMVIRRLARS